MVIQKSESVMNGFFQAFRMEVLRAIQNSFFPTTYFAILITLFLNIYLYTTTDSYVSVAYLLEYSFIGSLTMLFYVWGVLPHGLSYCVDNVFSVHGYELHLSDTVNTTTLVLGISTLIVAEVFAIGLKMKEEQDLTI